MEALALTMPTIGSHAGEPFAARTSGNPTEPETTKEPGKGSGPFIREELIRILMQSLHDLGLHDSYQALQREAQMNLEAPIITTFRQSVLKGDWESAESKLSQAVNDASVRISEPPPEALEQSGDKTENFDQGMQGIKYVRFQIFEQQYLELLEAGHVSPALRILREQLAPIAPQSDRLQALSGFVLCSSPTDLHKRAEWDGASGRSRQVLLDRIEKVIDTRSMLPSGRLNHLLEQGVAYQRSLQLYYSADSTAQKPPSLLTDFVADPNTFPRHNTRVLEGHSDEVWTVRFSSSGRLLASAGRDHIVTIWDIDAEFRVVARFEHRDPVSSVDFSADDKKVLVASEEEVTLWDLESGHGSSFVEHKHTVSSVRFLTLPTNAESIARTAAFVSGAMDHSILFWDTNGTIVSRLSLGPFRVASLDVTPDGKYLVAVGWRPSLSKAAVRAEPPLRDSRGRPSVSNDSITTLLPLSLTGGAYIPYDIRHYASIAGSRANNLDLLSLPSQLTEEAQSHRRQAQVESPEDREALGEPIDDLPATQSSHECRSSDNTRIFIFDMIKQTEVCSLYVHDTLQNVAISTDSRYALLSGTSGDIVLLNIGNRRVQQHYHGHRCSEFVIRASLGGSGEDLAGGLSAPFVVSGSEDSHIYLWHRASGCLMENSCRHARGAVNDISWRPRHSHMMASCGDDGTVRIWQPTKPEDGPEYHKTDRAPVTPKSRTGTYAHNDYQRTDESREVLMEDDPGDNPVHDPELLSDFPQPARLQVSRDETPEPQSRRVQDSPGLERSTTAQAPPRPNLLPW